ncbi:MAG TPA: FAD-linked oxidase C-terminal domain-containing protein [Thermodesulfobacteriota bacterium]|nr:FAD-linked oxidase C-terminal domain-containing protein [Thermodesulfobacteriota bacterium]
MLSQSLIKELGQIVGKENIATAKEDLICYSYDATNQQFLPDAVVFPKNADEISLILKLANKEGFPVVPRGAGSGFSGGSLPVECGVVVSLERMNKILKIDADNLIAIVEPGVVTGELQWAVEDLGLFYPPDPSSLKFCTIGGNVAECAGGPRAVKYGVTKDYVLGLEVVLPTGDIINTGAQTLKDVVGYDLTKLMVGSEGTLGIVTKIILKLLPLPEAAKTMLAVFSDMRDAATTVSNIISSRIIPSTLEFMDKNSISCVDDYSSMGLPTDVEALLLIEVDGAKELVENQAETIKKICLDNGAREVRIAGDKREVKQLWQVRRAISPALAKLKPNKINEDIVVPRSKIPDAIIGVKEIAKKYNLTNANFGHAGDGNIHVNIMIDKSDKDEFEKAEKAVKEIFELVLDFGGTISGEHGIGISKMPYIGMELSQPAIEVMKKIKQVLDPKGILNPGKIFPQ